MNYDYPKLQEHLAEHGIEDWIAIRKKAVHPLSAWAAHLNRATASMRAHVEHPFRVVKRQFGYTKIVYRGLGKNTSQLITLFALSNLWKAQRALTASAGGVRP